MMSCLLNHTRGARDSASLQGIQDNAMVETCASSSTVESDGTSSAAESQLALFSSHAMALQPML